MWHDVGNTLNLNLSLNKGAKGKEGIPFSGFFFREREKRRAKSFLPRSTEFRRLNFVEPRTKVHRIDKGYVWV